MGRSRRGRCNEILSSLFVELHRSRHTSFARNLKSAEIDESEWKVYGRWGVWALAMFFTVWIKPCCLFEYSAWQGGQKAGGDQRHGVTSGRYTSISNMWPSSATVGPSAFNLVARSRGLILASAPRMTNGVTIVCATCVTQLEYSYRPSFCTHCNEKNDRKWIDGLPCLYVRYKRDTNDFYIKRIKAFDRFHWLWLFIVITGLRKRKKRVFNYRRCLIV